MHAGHGFDRAARVEERTPPHITAQCCGAAKDVRLRRRRQDGAVCREHVRNDERRRLARTRRAEDEGRMLPSCPGESHRPHSEADPAARGVRDVHRDRPRGCCRPAAHGLRVTPCAPRPRPGAFAGRDDTSRGALRHGQRRRCANGAEGVCVDRLLHVSCPVHSGQNRPPDALFAPWWREPHGAPRIERATCGRAIDAGRACARFRQCLTCVPKETENRCNRARAGRRPALAKSGR